MDEHLKALRFFRLMIAALKSYNPAYIKITLGDDGDIQADIVMEE